MSGLIYLGMTGVMLGAASAVCRWCSMASLYAAALAACQIAPQVKPYLIPSHYSAEKVHAA